MSRCPDFQKSVLINSKATIIIALYLFAPLSNFHALSKSSRSKLRSRSLISGNRYQCFGSSDHMLGSTRERTRQNETRQKKETSTIFKMPKRKQDTSEDQDGAGEKSKKRTAHFRAEHSEEWPFIKPGRKGKEFAWCEYCD